MTELYRHIGPETDVPAGDIGVGAREVGYLFGQYKRIANQFNGVITGKGYTYGGSLIRPEATGYGLLFFVEEMLKQRGDSVRGKVITVSGSGNVAQYAIEKAIQLGGKPVTASDSSGMIYDPNGIDLEKLAFIKELKNVRRGRISDYAEKYQVEYQPGQRPWHIPCDIALPCATQNELDDENARNLIDNGCILIAEGANMPTTPEAIRRIQNLHLMYAPGKASNAGGVATSGLEMTQNALHASWTAEKVETELKQIMQSIHSQCKEHGQQYNYIDYVKGANLAGFIRVAEAMLAEGHV